MPEPNEPTSPAEPKPATAKPTAPEATKEPVAEPNGGGALVDPTAAPEGALAPDKPAAAPVVPEKYDFKLDGVEPDKDVVELATPLFREAKFTQEQAQVAARVFQRMNELGEQAEQAQSQRWAQEIRQDPEFGGQNYEKTVQQVRQVLRRFGDPDLTKLIAEYRLENHPALYRLMARIGNVMSEDTLKGALFTQQPARDQQDALLRSLYPTMYEDTAAPQH